MKESGTGTCGDILVDDEWGIHVCALPENHGDHVSHAAHPVNGTAVSWTKDLVFRAAVADLENLPQATVN